MYTPTFATAACLPRSYPSNGQLPPADLFAGLSHELNQAHEFFWPVARKAQLTSFSVVASCGLLPRTTRPGPRLRTAFWSVAKYNVSYVSGPTQAECHPELAKDPRPKRSTRQVADPSTSLAGSLRSG